MTKLAQLVVDAPSKSYGKVFDAPTITFIYIHNIFYEHDAPTDFFPWLRPWMRAWKRTSVICNCLDYQFANKG